MVIPAFEHDYRHGFQHRCSKWASLSLSCTKHFHLSSTKHSPLSCIQHYPYHVLTFPICTKHSPYHVQNIPLIMYTTLSLYTNIPLIMYKTFPLSCTKHSLYVQNIPLIMYKTFTLSCTKHSPYVQNIPLIMYKTRKHSMISLIFSGTNNDNRNILKKLTWPEEYTPFSIQSKILMT